MAGARGKSGGARPNAGRKPKPVADYRETMRGVFLEVVPQERWQRIVDVAAEQAEAGNKDARAWLAPWVVGTPVEESKVDVNLSGEVGLRITPWSPAT